MADLSVRDLVTMARLSARDLVTAVQRLLWSVVRLSDQPWLSAEERGALEDVRVLARMMFGDMWPDFADAARLRELAAAIVEVERRGEAEVLREWYISAVRIVRVVYAQRREDLDAEMAARLAEWDAIWERTAADVLSLTGEAWRAICRGMGRIVEGVGRAAGAGVGQFLRGLFSGPGALVVLAAAAWWWLSRDGGSRG